MIRINNWIELNWKEIFYFPILHSGHQASRLSHFSTNFKNEVLVDFNDSGWLDMLDIAYSSSSNCSRSLDNQELPELRAHLCKIRPILQKKGENLDFRLFFGFECCYYVMMIILTVLTDITNLLKGIMMQSLANHV